MFRSTTLAVEYQSVIALPCEPVIKLSEVILFSLRVVLLSEADVLYKMHNDVIIDLAVTKLLWYVSIFFN